MTTKFRAMNAKSGERNENNDCSVIALAIVANVDYDYAHEALKLCGRRDRQGTFPNMFERALELIGGHYVAREVFMPKRDAEAILRHKDEVEPQELYPNKPYKTINHWVGYTMTVNRLEDYVDPRKRYVASTRGHVLAIVDGKVQDWTGGRRHRVLNLTEVGGAG